jgi:hypothetical protein
VKRYAYWGTRRFDVKADHVIASQRGRVEIALAPRPAPKAPSPAVYQAQ